MVIMFGNLSLTEMQKRLGIELSADDILQFPQRQENMRDGFQENTWHCFDMPFLIECDSEATAKQVMAILKPYEEKMSGTIQIGWEQPPEN